MNKKMKSWLQLFNFVVSFFKIIKNYIMAIDNQISISFTPQEVTQMYDALTVIENIIKPKVVNLTPKQRKKYSKISNKMEHFAAKSVNYIDLRPDLVPFFVDVPEMKKDIEARRVLDPMLKRLSILYEEIDDTNKLVGYDVYQCIIAYYRNIRMLDKQNVSGIDTIYEDLSKHFAGRPKKTKKEK
jgi:hypothetical protein